MNLNSNKLGWLVAAALAGAMAVGALSGFQGTAPKFATVDVEKVFAGSKLRDTNNTTLNNANKVRLGALEFISQNLAMSNADARKYYDLSIVEKPTAAQTADLAKLKADAEAATNKSRELSTKTTLTDAEKALVNTYGENTRAKRPLLGAMEAEYQEQMRNIQADLRDKTLERVNEVVRDIAAKGAYTVVFNTASAPYAANDLTQEALNKLK